MQPSDYKPGADLYWELSYIVTRLFSEAPDSAAPVASVVRLLARRLNWDVVTFWRVDEAHTLLVCVEVWRAPEAGCERFEHVTRARQFSFGEGLPGTAWKEGVTWKVDVTQEPNSPRASVAQLDGLHTGVGFPIYAGKRVLGIIECFSREMRQPDPGLQNFFQALGGQIGVFYERMLTHWLPGAKAEFQLLAEGTADAVLTIDEESTVLFANSAVERIFGYAPAELVGQKLTVIMPEYLRHVHEAGIRRYVETGKRHLDWSGVPLPGLHKDGHEIPLFISFGEFFRDGRRVFTGFCRRLKERRARARVSSARARNGHDKA